jgi:NADH dehydrogenase
MSEFDVVTGAFSYSGSAIARELMAAGRRVRTLTGHPGRYPYFRGKAAVEQALRDLRIPHAVLRPAILFGGRGVLINNIAWLLRHLPVFAVGGTGRYRIRPIHVDDLARLCVRAGSSAQAEVINAVGSERPSFIELVSFIKDAVGSRSLEYQAMADGLADTEGPATGETSLTQWITEHAGTLGRRYANELELHFR